MGANLAGPWIKGIKVSDDTPERFKKQFTIQRWPHEDEGVVLPMPSDKKLHRMNVEFYQRCEGEGVGPVTAAWRDSVFAWARQLKVRFFGDSPQVTGLWSKAKERFATRLQVLRDKELIARVMQEVEFGVRMPFESVPDAPILAHHNHPDLSLRSADVFKALCTQLKEGSLEPFDVSSGKRPKGVYSLRWVEKSNGSVRLTLNGRPVNMFFPFEACTITLETHRELRSQYALGQMYVGFDLHNGFFNQQYHADDMTWVCFRIHKDDMSAEHIAYFKKHYRDACAGDYIYFSYRGLVMGLGPSCQQLARVNQAILRAWRCFAVEGVRWDGTSFIDDLMAWIMGSFKGALELSLRLLAEQVILGFSVNLNEKSPIVPTRFYCHIGVCISSTKMRFTLPGRRVVKMRATAEQLHTRAHVGKPVSAKLVARFIGQLWSANIVCFRAVAIMARGLIRTLATMLRSSPAMGESDPSRLRYILRRVWGGNVIWTLAAQQDLDFWLKVSFASLSTPISHDVWSAQVEHWVLNPSTGKVADDVKVFAVDTSDSMSGGGEFLHEGGLWVMRKGMAVRLTDAEVITSSTMRELLGVERLDLTLIPDSCVKAIVALDSQAAVACLLHGSGVEVLQQIVRRIFLKQLQAGRVLWPVWVRRCNSIIVQCDLRSRFEDRHAYTTEPKIFWKANAFAKRLWGRGFQVDVCADMHNVQPVDRTRKLPFYSRWASPHASATDMLQQNWRGWVNWCNPPFALLPRIIALVREQQACVAILVPCDMEAVWMRNLCVSSRHILRVWEFRPGAAIMFLDFSSRPPSSTFKDGRSAESFNVRAGTSRIYSSLLGHMSS